jgi:hypothetical protein
VPVKFTQKLKFFPDLWVSQGRGRAWLSKHSLRGSICGGFSTSKRSADRVRNAQKKLDSVIVTLKLPYRQALPHHSLDKNYRDVNTLSFLTSQNNSDFRASAWVVYNFVSPASDRVLARLRYFFRFATMASYYKRGFSVSEILNASGLPII